MDELSHTISQLDAKKISEGEVKVKVDSAPSASSTINSKTTRCPPPHPPNPAKKKKKRKQKTALTSGAKLQSSKEKANKKLNPFSKHIKELTIRETPT